MYRVTPTADLMFQKVKIIKQILQDNGIKALEESLAVLDTYALRVRYHDPQDSLENTAKFINKILELYDYEILFSRHACPFCRKYENDCTRCSYARNKGTCTKYNSLYKNLRHTFIPLLAKASEVEHTRRDNAS